MNTLCGVLLSQNRARRKAREVDRQRRALPVGACGSGASANIKSRSVCYRADHEQQGESQPANEPQLSPAVGGRQSGRGTTSPPIHGHSCFLPRNGKTGTEPPGRGDRHQFIVKKG